MPHLYFYLEDLNLTPAQRQALIEAVKADGEENAGPLPARRNHWRLRLDQRALILEGAFRQEQLSAARFRQALAGLYGVAVSAITVANVTTAYGAFASFAYNNLARLRLGVFGGVDAAWEQSRQAALAYLAANPADWESAS